MLCGNIYRASIILVVGYMVAMGQGWITAPDLAHFDIEDLMQIKVVPATKVEQTVESTASTVFVITQDDIRRSGVTNIPDALRLVPVVRVARIDANKWAITIRGFNGRFANKLLMLVDRRSIHTPAVRLLWSPYAKHRLWAAVSRAVRTPS